jgi:hypothetical protein
MVIGEVTTRACESVCVLALNNGVREGESVALATDEMSIPMRGQKSVDHACRTHGVRMQVASRMQFLLGGEECVRACVSGHAFEQSMVVQNKDMYAVATALRTLSRVPVGLQSASA